MPTRVPRRTFVAGAAFGAATVFVRSLRAAEYTFRQYHNQPATSPLHQRLVELWSITRRSQAATACFRTWSHSGGVKSGSGWRSAPSVDSCSSAMGNGLKLTCVGLAAGLTGALVLTRVMETLLFGVRPSDPATLAGVAALIAAVAAAASPVPAVRATRVDPMVALREE